MAIRFFYDESDFRVPDKGRIRRWIGCAVEGEGRCQGAVNFIFCSPARHLEMNRHFLGHDWPTDVITFSYSQMPISGDIFIDPETVAQNAAALCVAPEVEMRRVMVHGVLHLCGLDDRTPRQRRAMRAKEDFYLSQYYGTTI